MMITSEMMSDLAAGKLPSFILTSKGVVQLMHQTGIGTGLVVATTHAAAKKLATQIKDGGNPVR